MKINLLLSSALFLYSSFSIGAGADMISATNAYVRSVPPGMMNSAAFMQLSNNDKISHAVVSASSPAAKSVELHTHVEENGMMKMRQVNKIELAAGAAVELKPGGLHVMLIGLVQDLVPDTMLEVTLNFEDGSHKILTAPVKSITQTMMQQNQQH